MESEEDSSLTSELSLPDVTEYVRQQLVSMGVSNVDEQELQAYTKDFLQLLKDRSDEEHSFESVSQKKGVVHTPGTTSAVFKTVLHEGRDEITDLPAMATPISEVAQKRISNSILEVSVSSSGSHQVKRKVLRKSNLSCLDESLASSVDETQSPSVTESVQEEHSRHTCYHQRQPKSYFVVIRPATTHPHNRRLRKTDPVQRYHEFREIWETQKPPGEEPRHTLRWHIREQLLSQDIPIYEPHHRRVCKSSNYVVPTSKKRQALRWEVRHQLAQQVQ